MTLARFNKKHILIALVLLLVLGGLFYAFTAFGVTRTWDGGGGDANWHTPANWSGDTVPGAGDIAAFDGTCVANCSPTINGVVSVAGIDIGVGYTATITQSGTSSITVGSSHWVQAGGTFVGGSSSSSIDINGTFTLSGGTFTSTSGNLNIVRPTTAAETIFIVSGGTFNHNNGTVKFAPSFTSCNGSPVYTIDVMTSLTLYNVDIAQFMSGCGALTSTITTASGDTIIASNNFTQTDGFLEGTWEVQGNIFIGAGADGGGGGGTLTMNGTGSKTYTYTAGGKGPHLRVNNAGISVSANSGTTDLKTDLFTLLAGTFTAPSGTMTVGRSAGTSETIFTLSGGTFNHNNGTVKFSPFNNNCSTGQTFTVDVVSSLTLYNVDIDRSSTCGYQTFITTASGDTIIASNNFTHTTGTLEGTWEVQGNVIIGAGADGGTGTLTMNGTGSKTYTYTAGGKGPHLRVNNAGISVSANSGTTDLKTDLFTLLAGTFTAPSGTMTVGRSAGTSETIFTLSGGTFNHNNGTVKFAPSFPGCNGPAVATVDVETSLTLYNVDIAQYMGACGVLTATITTAPSDTIIASNNLIQTDGILEGTWQVQGNYTVGAGADGGTASTTFTGGNNQTYTDQGGNEPDGDVLINKSGGTVTLASNADWNATNQDLTITSGTLAQSSYNITTNNMTVNGGTFSGGSGTIDVNRTFTLSSGIFTSTNGTLEVGYSESGDITFFTVSGGTFNHNNGTVKFVEGQIYGSGTFTVDVPTTLTLYNIEWSCSGGGVCYSNYLTTAAGDTVIAANNFTHTDGVLDGTWEVQGNYTIGTTADGGFGTITMTGTGSKTYTYVTGGLGSHLRINNAALSVVSNTTDLRVSFFSLLAGSFQAPPGVFTVGTALGVEPGNIFVVSSGTTFGHNNGTVKFAGGDVYSPTLMTVVVPTTLTLYNIEWNSGVGPLPTLTTSGTVIAANNFTITDGYLNGTWEVQGNYSVATTADGGSAGITFTGGSTQTYTDNGGNEPDGDVTINKTANAVVLNSNADWNAAGQDLTITSGTLLQRGTTSVSTGAVTVGASGKWIANGTGTTTLGGNLVNNGLIDYRSNNSCGGADILKLRSSDGTQRLWSGSGTTIMRDVDVKDQGGSLAITANSCTNTSGNGANWTFTDACVFVGPDLVIPNTPMRIGSGRTIIQ